MDNINEFITYELNLPCPCLSYTPKYYNCQTKASCFHMHTHWDRTSENYHSFRKDNLVTFNATISIPLRNKRLLEGTHDFLVYFFERTNTHLQRKLKNLPASKEILNCMEIVLQASSTPECYSLWKSLWCFDLWVCKGNVLL